MNSKPNRPPGTPETGIGLDELVDGASIVFDNAADLYEEARALHRLGALSRALFLHQISLEECAKVDMLGTRAVCMLAGMESDFATLTQAFASHRAKNYTNAYMLPATSAERDAVREKRWNEAIDAFKGQQAEFHVESNAAKNASLYVDFQRGVFSAPKDRISEAMVSEVAAANEEFLSATRSKVEMMKGWRGNPDRAHDLAKWFMVRLEELASEHDDDPGRLVGAIIEEMFVRAKEMGYVDTMKGYLEDRDTRRD
jgi:AbiV family abortive infection protein